MAGLNKKTGGLGDLRQPIFYGLFAILSLVLAVLGFVTSSKRDSAALSALFVICSVLLIFLAILFVTLAVLSLKTSANFFLYDMDLQRNIRPADLTPRLVNDRLDEYISDYFGSPQRLLSSGEFVGGQYGRDDVLCPAVAYRLLFLASENASVMTAFEECDRRTLSALCAALREAGETDMPSVLERHRESGGETEKLARFLGGNRKYLQSRLMTYIKRNMERFY